MEIDFQQIKEAAYFPLFVHRQAGDGIARHAVPKIQGVGQPLALIVGVAKKFAEEIQLLP